MHITSRRDFMLKGSTLLKNGLVGERSYAHLSSESLTDLEWLHDALLTRCNDGSFLMETNSPAYREFSDATKA